VIIRGSGTKVLLALSDLEIMSKEQVELSPM
jgi:hypothetical protein